MEGRYKGRGWGEGELLVVEGDEDKGRNAVHTVDFVGWDGIERKKGLPDGV